MNQGTGW